MPTGYAHGKKIYILLTIFVVLLIFTHYIGALKGAESALRSLTVPILSTVHRLSTGQETTPATYRSATSTLTCSSSSLAFLQTQAELTLTRDENTELRKQLNFQKKQPYGVITAEVIGRETLSIDQTLLINRGSAANIQLDEPVIAGDGILVGKIIQVQKDVATVRLLNDNQSKVGATIINHDHSLGAIEGGYGISLKMTLIPRDEVVAVGDTIVSSGLETNIPRGLLIGTVNAVENEPYKPFQQAIVTPAVDLSKLTIVGVLQTINE